MNPQPQSKQMKNALILCFLLAANCGVLAQEQVSLEEAQKGARFLTQSAGKIGDAPFQVEVDLDKPAGLKAGEVRILVLPDQKLTGEVLAKIGKSATPLGQLWLHAIAPAKDGKVVLNDQLRVVTVSKDDKDFKVLLLFLGMQKGDKGELELVVYGKNKVPLLRLPVEKITAQQELPIEVQGRKDGEGAGTITVSILGKYKAELAVMKPAE